MPALLAILVSATLVATCASPGPTASPSGSTPPAASPSPSGSPEGAWTDLELPPLARVASLEPTLAGVGGVSPETAFRLTSLAGAPVGDMATRLVVTPGLDLQVTETAGETAVLTPAAPLEQGRVYRFELVRPDGTAEAAWAVQAAWPLRVASTIPGDGSTDVPRDTGIEIAFDQAGVLLEDLRTHVSISPQVPGRFEPHGLTFAYVPDEPLKPATLYTVTVRRGLPLPGTGMTLEQDFVFGFETTGDAVARVHITAARPLFDAGTRERPILSVRLDIPWDEETDSPVEQVSKLPLTVHRLPGLDAAIDAFVAVRAAPDWTIRTGSSPVVTTGLPQVMRGTVRLRELDSEESAWFRLPARLPAGWYVVTMTYAGLPRQTILQVTDVAAFAMVSDTRSLVWANDLRTNAPIRQARVTLGGTAFGRTDAEGLVTGRTPAALFDDLDAGAEAVAIVRSGTRAAFVPLTASWWCGTCDDEASRDWWHLLTLDRELYRASDVVNAWGVVRNRDTGDVPGSVTVRLVPDAADGRAVQPAVASVPATPDASGAFLAELAYRNVPAGSYRVTVHVGDETVASSWLSIGPIAKPAWQVELSVPHRAVVTGTSVPVSAVATFFEGTPVAGAELRFGNSWDDGEEPSPLATTDAGGRASAQLVLRQPEEESVQWTELGLTARASEPEEGDISTEIPMVVFASTAVLDAQSVVRGRRLVVTGAVHDVDLARYDAVGADLGSVDPRGAPRAGATVTVKVTEVTAVVRRTGTTYDFIAKRTVPSYDLTERRRSLGTRTVTTAPDGRYRLAIPVKSGDRSYEVVVTYTDEAGRRITQSADAWVETDLDPSPDVSATDGDEGFGEYAVGDTVKVRFRHGIRNPEVQRYLFAVMARGLRDVSVQDSARFSTRFTDDLVPNASITGVRFTGTAYEPAINAFTASLRTDDRSLTVSLAADRDRYAPGGRATVSISVHDVDGRPAAASVFVRAIDEKLFRMAAVTADDPLGELYASTGSGLMATAWSHASVRDEGDGKGDTGGGDGRADFRDWLVARMVTTGADGRASVSFDLSDDLTSWRVLASAVTPGMAAGAGSVALPVGLPFFAEATVAPQYLAADRPVIRLRGFGADLRAGAPVTFRISSDTLPMTAVTVEGTAFEPVEVALPPLRAGTHRLTIEAATGAGSARRTDTLTRTFEVVETRTVSTHVAAVPLAAGTTVGGGDGPTTVFLVDAGRGRVVPALRELAVTEPFRADSAIAAAIARDLLADEFGIPDRPGLPEPDLLAFQGSGISLLPYASPDLDLSAMAAFSGDSRIDRGQLHSYFDWLEQDAAAEDGGGLPIDRQLSLLLGRASIGEASIGEVTAAAALAGLEPAQRVMVALAALALGDEVLAREIYRDLLDRHGQRQGPWVRLDAGDPNSTAVATARLAIVAAALGDPLAAGMDAEVTAHPATDTLVDLERAIAADWWARRVPKADAVAAVTIDGRQSEVTITADEPVVLDVTPAQRAGLRIDPVSGSVIVMSQWDGPVTAGDLTAPEGLKLTRIAATETIEPTQTVVVRFQVRLGPKAASGCWQVTDFAPSGLAPIPAPGLREEEAEDDEGNPSASGPETPWRVVGQRVDFCVFLDPKQPIRDLRYLARVVTPGTYRWEPAVIQSSVVPEEGLILAPFEVTIAGLGS